MSHTLPSWGYHRGNADALLDLVDRAAPQLMRTGWLVGVGDIHERKSYPRDIGAQVELAFRTAIDAGTPYSRELLNELADRFGLHYQSVCKFTRAERRRHNLKAR